MSETAFLDAVSIVSRVCPNTKSGNVAKSLASKQILEMEPENWMRSSLDELLVPCFEAAQSSSASMVSKLCAEHRFGLGNKELNNALNSAVEKTLSFSEVVMYFSMAYIEVREQLLLKGQTVGND